VVWIFSKISAEGIIRLEYLCVCVCACVREQSCKTSQEMELASTLASTEDNIFSGAL